MTPEKCFVLFALSLVVILGVFQAVESNRVFLPGSGTLAHTYTSVKELRDAAPVIVLGTMGERTQVMDLPWAPQSRMKWHFQEFVPSKVLKGNLGKSIWICGYGVNENGKWIGALGEGLYAPNSIYVLFLTRETGPYKTPSDDEFYGAVGAYQGAFRVKDGKVFARHEIGEAESMSRSAKANGQGLLEFLDSLSK